MSLKNIKFKVTNLPLALTKHPTSLEMTVHTKKKSRLSLIVRVNVVLNRAVVVAVVVLVKKNASGHSQCSKIDITKLLPRLNPLVLSSASSLEGDSATS